jgi:hypothetical protein
LDSRVEQAVDVQIKGFPLAAAVLELYLLFMREYITPGVAGGAHGIGATEVRRSTTHARVPIYPINPAAGK